MKVTIEDIMVKNVITTQKHQTIGHVKDIMDRNKIQCLPIVTNEDEVLGIVTIQDLLGQKDTSPVSQVMTKSVYSIPLYSGTHIAARVMRNHHIHHLVVTDEKHIVGVISSFDLLKLVENHRYVAKNLSTPKKKGGNKRE